MRILKSNFIRSSRSKSNDAVVCQPDPASRGTKWKKTLLVCTKPTKEREKEKIGEWMRWSIKKNCTELLLQKSSISHFVISKAAEKGEKKTKLIKYDVVFRPSSVILQFRCSMICSRRLWCAGTLTSATLFLIPSNKLLHPYIAVRSWKSNSRTNWSVIPSCQVSLYQPE